MSEMYQPAATEGPPEPPAENRQSNDLPYVFVGPEGLRAGWGLAIFLIVREILQSWIYPLFMKLFPVSTRSHGLYRPQGLLVFELAALLCVLIATLVMARIERRPLSAYGAATSHGLGYFLAGLGWGSGLLSVLVCGLRFAGVLSFDGWQLSSRSAFRYGAIWLMGFLLVGLYEESLSRGYLQFTLTRGLRGFYRLLGVAHSDSAAFWTAAVITSFAFGFGHIGNLGESAVGLTAAALIGLVFCLSLWRTGSLWWAIGFHASWDWAQSFFYGVADSGTMAQGHLLATHPVGRSILSGGSTGPEGSLFVFPVIALAAAVVLITLPANRTQGNLDTQ